MAESNELIDKLREFGVRITPQRAIILEVIEDLTGHLTAEEIFAEVQKINAYISLATVYRTLDLLKSMGLISEANLGSATTYYAVRDHGTHHHAVCRVCHKTIELPHELFEPIADALRTKANFKADVNHLVVFGWCESCAPQTECGENHLKDN